MAILWRASIIILSVFIFISCEDSDTTKVAEAQECVNNLPATASVTSAEVNVCLAKLGSTSSNAAYRIRCALSFIEQGFDNTQLQQAFDALDGGSNNVMLTMAAGLTFRKAGLNSDGSARTDIKEAADDAVTNCFASGSKGLHSLSVISQMGSIIANTGAGGIDPSDGVTAAELQAAAAAMGTSSDADLGATAVALNSIYCGDSATDAEACAELAGYLAAGNTAAIGAALRDDFDD